jgi:hypothetical protein
MFFLRFEEFKNEIKFDTGENNEDCYDVEYEDYQANYQAWG